MNLAAYIDKNWFNHLSGEFSKPYFKSLELTLKKESTQKTIFPPKDLIFNAYNLTPLDSVNVVIVGQDPYHSPNQANGLAFSVADGIKHPPSLRNIFKELKDDIGCELPSSGDLTSWAKQGVFLINSALSVVQSQPASHAKIGWHNFIFETIRVIDKKRDGVVYILWGKHAQGFLPLIDETKNCIITSPHPSPLSANRGFFGSKPFSKANSYLQSQNKKPISWCL